MIRSIAHINETARVLYQAFGKYKIQIVILVVLGFLGGLFEGVSITAIVPLFSFLVNADGAVVDPISAFLIRVFEYLPFPFNPISLLSLMVALFLAKALVIILFGYIRTRIIVDFKRQMSQELFGRALYAQWSFLLKQKLGHLQTTFIRDVQQGSGLFMALGHAILAFSTLIVYIIVAFTISPSITLLTAGMGLFVFLVLRPLMKRSKLIARKMATTEKKNMQVMSEHIIGLKVVKAAAVEEKILARVRSYLVSLRDLSVKSYLVRSLGTGFIQPASLIFIAVLFIVSYQQPGFNVGTLIATIYLIHRIFISVEAGQKALHSIFDLVPYAGDAIRLRTLLARNKEEAPGTKKFIFKKELSFERVSFSYAHGREVLRDINFVIQKGETVGLVGPSGAGKTSLVDLLLKLYQPTGGALCVDGMNINDISTRDWRMHLGYVSQDIFLTNDTIANNIQFYGTDYGIDDMSARNVPRRVIEAAKKAHIYEFINTLPRGFDTVVGDRGMALSAGQRQRVVLARELARDPELLILDEATSALDAESEQFVQKALADLRGKMTVIIIAHRLSTVLDVDKLFVLGEQGIVEQGNPRKLLENPESRFYELYHLKD